MKFFLTFLLIFISLSQSTIADSRIHIGAMSELTGAGAPNGKACRIGYEAADTYYRKKFSAADGLDVAISYADHRAEPKTGIAEFLRFVSVDHAVAVLSNRGNVGAAMDPLSKQLKVPLLGIMGHPDFIEKNPYGIRFWPSPGYEGTTLADAALIHNLKRAAMIVLHDDYQLSMAANFKKQFIEKGGKVVYSDEIDEAFIDFQSLASRIRSSNPDVIFVTGSVAQLGLIVKRLREQGMSQQILSNFWIQYDDVIKVAGTSAMEDVMYMGVDLALPEFQAAVRKIDGDFIPTMVTYGCFSSVAMIYEVLQSKPQPKSATEMYERLMGTPQVRLPDETLSIKNREVQYTLHRIRLKSGKSVIERQSATP